MFIALSAQGKREKHQSALGPIGRTAECLADLQPTVPLVGYLCLFDWMGEDSSVHYQPNTIFQKKQFVFLCEGKSGRRNFRRSS